MKEKGYTCENIYFSLIYDFSKNPIEHKDIIPLEEFYAKTLKPRFGFHYFHNK